MSQVPTPGKSTEPQTYEVLDAQGSLSPLGQLLRCAQDPSDASAVLVLRHKQSGELSSATIVHISEIEHDRTSGAVVFGGDLDDGRRIEGFVRATSTDDTDVLGSATISE